MGQRLGVGAVLEGKVRRAGERMRLTAQLTSVADGLILWSVTYDRDVKDAFGVQDDVARAIASALRVKLAGGDAPLNPHTTTNSEAHDLYLRGLYLQNRYTEPELRKSIELFEQALARDSAFAPAWAGVAQSWSMLSDDFISPKIALPKIREARAHGFAIDSTSPRLRLTAGTDALFYDRNPAAAVRLMTPALHDVEQWPNYVQFYAIALWLTGQRDSGWSERSPHDGDIVLDACAASDSVGEPA